MTESGAASAETVGWLGRLRAGLHRSSAQLAGGITSLLSRRKLDETTLGELEELLIVADLGAEVAARLTGRLADKSFDKEADANDVRRVLADEIASILDPVAEPLVIDPTRKPHVILVCGVNGSGKTTTVAKLAQQLKSEGRSVMLAAGDTFRAAAVEQLQVWGERTGCPVIAKDLGADAAGLAFDALQKARTDVADVLLIDTAGRLHSKVPLMAELQKVVRVVRKLDDSAPHDCVLVLDATVGQNAHRQVEVFRDMVEVSGLMMTKLDGTAKGGVVVALAERFGLPIHAVGVGESLDDMRPFSARSFACSLLGLDE